MVNKVLSSLPQLYHALNLLRSTGLFHDPEVKVIGFGVAGRVSTELDCEGGAGTGGNVNLPGAGRGSALRRNNYGLWRSSVSFIEGKCSVAGCIAAGCTGSNSKRTRRIGGSRRNRSRG